MTVRKKKIDRLEFFEQALDQDKKKRFFFRLYVSGSSPRSMKAVQNIKKICIEYLDGCYELEVIDVHQHPELVRDEDIIALPTLIRELPPPLRKFIGDLSNMKQILESLAIKPKGQSVQ